MTPLRLRKKILLNFLVIFFLWFFGLVWFIQQIPKSKNDFPASPEMAIVVLTGGGGRLEYGLQLLAEHRGKVLFISGVGEKVTVSDILRLAPDDTVSKINESNIVIGHQAENTIGNAEEIKNWLKDMPYKKILLVTSNYHMPRSLLELSTALPSVTFIPAPVIAGDNDLLLSEYHKYIASKLRHLFVSATKTGDHG